MPLTSAGWSIPLAIVMGIATGGAASAWFAGSSRIPFVAGLTSALPPALGRVHPRWHSPHVALITCAVLCAVFTSLSLVGSSVAEAYQVLLKAAVVIQLIPFVYLFLALVKTHGVSMAARAAGVVGLSDDGGGAGRGISPDLRCVERVGLRNQARDRGGRPDRARIVSLLARPRVVAGACRTNRVTCARMECS